MGKPKMKPITEFDKIVSAIAAVPKAEVDALERADKDARSKSTSAAKRRRSTPKAK